ncbi:MAG: hypothetical protein RI922_232 [Bacteroidota bacterium]|jgi:CheY-like chemotaxis protein
MKSFLLIEDDDIFNFIHNQIILQVIPDAKITIFKYAQQALDYLNEIHPNLPDYIFLDLNMPEMNGFEFLDNLSNSGSIDCTKTTIYLVTSSLDHRDSEHANSLEFVKSLIDKPLSIDFIKLLN